jgi:hypothetical protein
MHDASAQREHGEVSNRDMALIFVEDPLTALYGPYAMKELWKTAPKNCTSGLVKMEGQLCPKHLLQTHFRRRDSKHEHTFFFLLPTYFTGTFLSQTHIGGKRGSKIDADPYARMHGLTRFSYPRHIPTFFGMEWNGTAPLNRETNFGFGKSHRVSYKELYFGCSCSCSCCSFILTCPLMSFYY